MLGKVKQIIKPVARPMLNAIGVPAQKDRNFEDLFVSMAADAANESDRIKEIMDTLTDEEIMYQKGEGKEYFWHDGDQEPRDAMIFTSKYFIAKRVDLLMNAIPDIAKKSIIDIGATSDVIFRFIKKKGLGVNISKQAVEYMQKQGIEASVGNAEDLSEYADNSFDHLLSFQTVEHLENPIKSLREFKRITKEKLFITVPHTHISEICPFEPDYKAQHRWHVFELKPSDFEAMLSRVGLKILNKQVITPAPFMNSGNPLHKIFKLIWKHDPYFMGYVFYELEAEEK